MIFHLYAIYSLVFKTEIGVERSLQAGLYLKALAKLWLLIRTVRTPESNRETVSGDGTFESSYHTTVKSKSPARDGSAVDWTRWKRGKYSSIPSLEARLQRPRTVLISQFHLQDRFWRMCTLNPTPSCKVILIVGIHGTYYVRFKRILKDTWWPLAVSCFTRPSGLWSDGILFSQYSWYLYGEHWY